MKKRDGSGRSKLRFQLEVIVSLTVGSRGSFNLAHDLHRWNKSNYWPIYLENTRKIRKFFVRLKGSTADFAS